jgi:hypothetical protein
VPSRSLLELSTVAKLADPERWAGRHWMIALRDLTRIYVQRRLIKEDSVRSSNWSLMHLEDRQVEYAACDVVAGTAIMRELVPRLDALLKKRHEEATAASTAAGWFRAAPPSSDVKAQIVAPPAADPSLHMSDDVRALLQAQLTHVGPAVGQPPIQPPTTRGLIERQAQSQQALRDVERASSFGSAARTSTALDSTTAAARAAAAAAAASAAAAAASAAAAAAAALQRTMNDEAALLDAARMSDKLCDDVEAAARRHEISKVAAQARSTTGTPGAGRTTRGRASARPTVRTSAVRTAKTSNSAHKAAQKSEAVPDAEQPVATDLASPGTSAVCPSDRTVR